MFYKIVTLFNKEINYGSMRKEKILTLKKSSLPRHLKESRNGNAV